MAQQSFYIRVLMHKIFHRYISRCAELCSIIMFGVFERKCQDSRRQSDFFQSLMLVEVGWDPQQISDLISQAKGGEEGLLYYTILISTVPLCYYIGFAHFTAQQQNLLKMKDNEGFAIAIEEAKIGYDEGGVPVSNSSTISIQTFIYSSIFVDWSSSSFKRRKSPRTRS